jgi:Bacterial dnaA protein helix-turn-helix
MTNTAEELRLHYQAVRDRLNGAKRKPIQARLNYSKPIGPRIPREGRIIYAFPIGPREPPYVDIGYLHLKSPPGPSVGERILQEVCNAHKIFPAHIKSKSRIQIIVRARHEVIWRLRMEECWPCTKIARFLGYEDHTTVFYAMKKMGARRVGTNV